MALTLWASLNGAPIGDGPIFTALGGRVVLTELGQFSPSSVVLPGADARALLAMQPYTLLEVVQDGVGTIAYGYVLNPRQQITDRDDHTITLELEPLTVECTWRRTGIEWAAATALSVVAARLGALVPGWTGALADAAAGDPQVSVNLNNPTVLAGFLETARQFGQFARQGVANLAPARALEMGQFGAAPTVTLVSPDGGDPGAMRDNETIRLVATVDRQPNDVSSLANVCVPFGGGASADTLVTLERLWRMINDPQYVNYGRWGTDADSLARTGRPSLFPEYSPAYPIADPRTGARGVALSGRYLYPVYDYYSYQQYGHREADFTDSSLTYADGSVANQELTARALYVSAVANFKRRSQPHHAFTCTAPGTGLATRAGDLIAVDYRRASVGDDGGAVVEMAVTETLRVMAVVRAFDGDSPPMDTYTLSNLGRFEEDDAQAEAGRGQTLVALQRQQGTGLAKDSTTASGNVDALNPLTVWHYIAAEHFRYHQVRVRCDFFPFRGTATTAVNSAATITLSVPHGSHSLSGSFASQPAPVPGIAAHLHTIHVGGGTSTEKPLYLIGNGTLYSTGLPLNSTTDVNTTGPVALGATDHSHTTPIAAAPVTLEHPDTLTGPLPQHTHDVEKRIPTGQPSPASIALAIGGQGLSAGAASSGARDASGAFTSSFVVSDIGPYLDAFPPGTDVPLTFTAGTSAANPFGVGWIQVTVTAVEELGGLTSTVRAQ